MLLLYYEDNSMEKKNTGLIVLVVILSLLVVGLGGYIVYDKVLSKEDSNINNDKCDISEKYDFVSMSGYYFKNENDSNPSYGLYLLKNGMFKIRYTNMSTYGYIGNYTIMGDTLTLNYWFKYNSGAGWTLENTEKVIKILSYNSLEINDSSLDVNSIVLKKDNNNEIDDIIKKFDFYNDFKSNARETFAELFKDEENN